jgi:hypothetical protein
VEEKLFMNRSKLVCAGLCAAAVVGLSSAGAYAEEKIAPKTLEFLEATTISGYVEASYVANIQEGLVGRNQHNNDSSTVNSDKNVGLAGANQLRAFDNNAGFTLNAIKLVLEKPLGEGDWAAGYRADLLFGQDAAQLNRAEGTSNPNFDHGDTSSEQQGWGTYIEQGYVAFRVPIGNGLDFKLGRFVALSGYEVIESPANLNFSRGLLFTWAVPIAHTGLMGSYRFSDMVDAQVGIVNGWNNWIADHEDPSVIARLGIKNSSGTFSLGVSGFYGRARAGDPAFEEGGNSVASLNSAPRWFFDGVANFKPTEKVLLGLEALVGNQTHPDGKNSGTGNDQWWGIAGYGKVQVSDKVSLAGRAEYLNDRWGFLFSDDHASFDPIHDTDEGTRIQVFSLTGTINIDVWKNMLLRLETRYDQASTGSGSGWSDVPPFRTKNDQLTFAVDAVYSF